MKKSKTTCLNSSKKGTLIAFEGISGCGKSEGIKNLSKYLNSIGYMPKVIEWNSNKTIRRLVNWMHSKNVLFPLLYSILQWLSFTIDYFKKIRPLLKKDEIVIVDRYFYTGLTRDKVNGSVGILGKFISHLVRKPNILILFDTAPGICYERMQYRDKALFHTNKLIKQNRLLKNKDLYYLKKLRNDYVRLLKNQKLFEDTKVFVIKDNNTDFNESIATYITLRSFIEKERVA